MNLLFIFALLFFVLFLILFVVVTRRKQTDFGLGWACGLCFLAVFLFFIFGMQESHRISLEPTFDYVDYQKEFLTELQQFKETQEFKVIGTWLLAKYHETSPEDWSRRAYEIKSIYDCLQKGYSILWPLPEYHNPASLPPEMNYWIAAKNLKDTYPEGEIFGLESLLRGKI